MSAANDHAELGHLIFACLNGQAQPEDMARLETMLSEDREARRYYAEFLVIYAGLRQSPASLLGPATAAAAPSGEPNETGYSRAFETPIRDFVRRKSHPRQAEIDGDLSHRPVAQQEARREIESYARRQLEAFLEQQRRQERLARASRVEWDLASVFTRMVQAAGRVFATAFRDRKSVV